uniref:Glycosyltransferase n=2 Tax=Oryza sativa subsp. japonica TaxID=39947 RepID=Q75HJ2_ORYSJ|nr:putative UDP-glucoronosyl and UDP-glucosyl transferase [Oryza sativa Japonica Group]ABF99428.1 Glycosyltransferase family 28 N-terminal domain containing protein, expressed [Oryza sativa Japonica Group]
MGDGGGGGLDVVVFPWLAFGHMIPYLELSKRLAARGHDVTFVSTPRNVSRLPPVPAGLSARLRFVSLPMPPVDGLPEGAESTADVPPGNDELIKKACDGLAAPFAAFMADLVAAGGRKPDWIIIDFAYHWLPPIAAEHNAAAIAFLGPRWANAAHPRAPLDFTAPPRWFPPPSAMAYRRNEARWVVGAFRPNASGVSDIERMWRTIESCRFTIYRSCDEVEPGVLALLIDLFRRPAVPAGILLTPPPDLAAADDDDVDGGSSADRAETLRWLDEQPTKSVIYVALGSEAPVTAKNLQELALGLELAGVRFLWALRKPAAGTLSHASAADADELLPDGFEERTRGRGVVWTGWVPQVEVLAHAAVGAFLTHCGWGSTIESLVFGHPLVMLPFVVDQGLVARAMAERGVGVEVAREDDDEGSFGRHDVAAAVRRVMVEDERKVFGENARKMKEAVGDQRRQEQYFDELVERLHTGGGEINDEKYC